MIPRVSQSDRADRGTGVPMLLFAEQGRPETAEARSRRMVETSLTREAQHVGRRAVAGPNLAAWSFAATEEEAC